MRKINRKSHPRRLYSIVLFGDLLAAFGKTKKKPDEKQKPFAGGQKPQRPEASSAVKAILSPRGKEIRGIVRVAGKDVKGEVSLRRAVTAVKGVGERLGKIVSRVAFSKLNLPEDCMIGELSEDELDRLEQIMRNPSAHGVPVYMLNRRKDFDTGEDKHLIATDLLFNNKQDIEREKGMSSWRGYRHTYGKKVRGQRTRTTGRKGMSVGVLRKAMVAKAGAAALAAKEEKK